MGIIYKGRFAGRDGHPREVEFASDRWKAAAGEITLSADGVRIEEDNDEEQLKPFRVWSGKVSLVNTGFDQSRLLPRTPHDISFTLYRTAPDGARTVEYAGYVGTESRSQPWPGYMETVEIPVVSRLSTAAGYALEVRETWGIETLGALLREALLLCGYRDTDTITWPGRYTLTSAGASRMEVLSLEVSRAVFMSERDESEKELDEAEKGWKAGVEAATAETVITEICKLFGYTMHDSADGPRVTMPGVTEYAETALADLTDLDPAEISDFDVKQRALESVALEGTEHTADYLPGAKDIRVTTKWENPGSLLPAADEGRVYVNNYGRFTSFAQNAEPTIQTGVYEPVAQSFLGIIEAVPYYRESAGQTDDYTKGWIPGDAETVRGWDYTPRYINGYPKAGSKPGAFHARIYDETPSDKEGEIREIDRSKQSVDGYVINPSYLESGEFGYIGKDYPVLYAHSRAEYSFQGGSFILRATIGSYSNGPAQDSHACYPDADFYARLEIGGVEVPFITDLRGCLTLSQKENDDGTADFPSGAELQTTMVMKFVGRPEVRITDGADTIFIASRYLQELPGAIKGPLRGAVTLIVYVQPRSGMMFFISDLSLEWVTHRTGTYSYETSPGDKEEHTIIYKSEKGFAGENISIDLPFCSYQYGAPGTKNSLIKGTDSRILIWDRTQKREFAPEDALALRLHEAHDRVTEKLTLQTDTRHEVKPGEIITYKGKSYAVEAVTVDYSAGQNTLTLIETI